MFVHQRYKFYFSNDRNLILVTTLSFWIIPKNRIQEKNYKNENVIFIYFLKYSERYTMQFREITFISV